MGQIQGANFVWRKGWCYIWNYILVRLFPIKMANFIITT